MTMRIFLVNILILKVFTLLPEWLTKAYSIAILQLIALNVASEQKGLYSMQLLKNDENYH